jgi:hypothetical protein
MAGAGPPPTAFGFSFGGPLSSSGDVDPYLYPRRRPKTVCLSDPSRFQYAPAAASSSTAAAASFYQQQIVHEVTGIRMVSI